MESSNYLYHFTDDKDTLKSIVRNGFWVQYSCEDVSFLRHLSDEVDWDRVLDEMVEGGDENGKVEQEEGGDPEVGDNDKVYIPMVCFCDIPHYRIDNHAGKDDSTDYGPYAVVLEKKWGRQRGVNPVSYVVPESDFVGAFQEFDALTEDADVNHENWQIRSVFRTLLQFLKPYEDEANEKRYYDEREWRYISNVDSTLYWKSVFESKHICRVHSTLCATFDEIECLIVKDSSEVEEVKAFLREDLNGDADRVPVRTFEKVKDDGVK